MKTETLRPLRSLWLALSEVPGWPDAPFAMRLRRLWPLLLPLTACAGLAVWTYGVRDRTRDAVRAAHGALLALEADTEVLRQSVSEQSALDWSAAAGRARGELLESPAQFDEQLTEFASSIAPEGWSASHQTYGRTDEPAGATGSEALAFVPARVRLDPRPVNGDRFNTLIRVLNRMATMPGRVEITRVVIRSDAAGLSTVEVNLRAACRADHEKAPQ